MYHFWWWKYFIFQSSISADYFIFPRLVYPCPNLETLHIEKPTNDVFNIDAQNVPFLYGNTVPFINLKHLKLSRISLTNLSHFLSKSSNLKRFKVSTVQCGSLTIFLPLFFYVKSILAAFRWWENANLTFLAVLNFEFLAIFTNVKFPKFTIQSLQNCWNGSFWPLQINQDWFQIRSDSRVTEKLLKVHTVYTVFTLN